MAIDLPALKAKLQQHLQQAQSKPCSLELLAHGEANVIFRLNQTALVRVAVNTPNQRFEGDIRRVTQFEQTILHYLQGTNISHQVQGAWLEPNQDFPYSYLITNYLEGNALDYSRSHLAQCAQTLAQLHRLPLSAEYAIDRLAAQIPTIQQPLTRFYHESKSYAQPYLDFDRADPEIVEMLQLLLAKAEARLTAEQLLSDYPYVCLVHSDHTYENWVINDRKAHLIDWEWAELGSPAGDLGHFLSPVTICRRQNYQLPAADRAFFLQTYYDALADDRLAVTMQRHFAAFGAYPAVRSLCWTAGYWLSVRWYEGAIDDSPSAAGRSQQLQESRSLFPQLWQAVMARLAEEP